MNNKMLDGVMGVVVGDALGLPVEFCTRKDRDNKPVDGMWGYGTFNMPAGTWSDDSSLTLATLDALSNGHNLKRIADNFMDWYMYSAYTPAGKAFDVGNGTASAIVNYIQIGDVYTCGGTSVFENGNGSLMRIIPACIYCVIQEKENNMSCEDAIKIIHELSGLTHNHLRSKIACGLYYFIVREIMSNNQTTLDLLIQKGLDNGFAYYGSQIDKIVELAFYGRTRDVSEFKNVDRDDIKSSGYVVDTFEAAIWCLITTNSYSEAVLKAVNLGRDTDTVAAVTGGLAGLFYGIESIPKSWLEVIIRREYIEELCESFQRE